MALTLTPQTPVSRIERTERVHIVTPTDTNLYYVEVHRATYDIYADGTQVLVSSKVIHRTLAQLQADVDAAPMISSLPAIFDRWSQEDAQA